MENNNTNTLDESIEKVFKKYTLEVDDAMEAHGFKASSFIDNAEDTISELENKMKEKASIFGIEVLFKNLEDTLQDTVSCIVDGTKKLAYERSNSNYHEEIDLKANQLHSVLDGLNTRFICSLEKIQK